MPPPIKCQKDNLSLNIIKAQRPDPIGSPSKEDVYKRQQLYLSMWK